MKKKSFILQIIIVLFVTILTCAGIFIFYLNVIPDNRSRGYPVGVDGFNNKGEFYIDPQTAIIALGQNKKNILTPVVATPEGYPKPLPKGESYLWSYADHTKIKDILWHQVWGDESNDWSIFGMSFYAGCQDAMTGFSISDFVYFKSVNTENGTEYSSREITIRPLYGMVEWGSGNFYPRPLFGGWKDINLEELKVTADVALRIAEENGGNKMRMKVNNQCTISLDYYPNLHSEEWQLAIYPDGKASSIFEIYINPFTGSYKILK